MQLTMTGDYAIRALVYMASNPTQKIFQISDISKESNIPDNLLRKIIPLLTKAGFINTLRGAGGGVIFSKSAEEITPLEVVESIEGKIALNKCVTDKSFCSKSGWCAVHCLWLEAQEKLKDVLSSRTIAQLAAKTNENFEKFNTKRKKLEFII